MGKELLAFASPKAALTWASTFDEGGTPYPIPELSTPRRSFPRWIAGALAAVGAAVAIAWCTPRAPAPQIIETSPPVTVTAPAIAPSRVVIPAEKPGRGTPSRGVPPRRRR
jgi:hypothetical protein